jgi:predicted N-acetyltransferase YhbS
VTLRVATDEDFPAILEVHRRAFVDDPGVPGIVEGLHALGLHVPSLSFVALEDDRVVGHVMSSWSEIEGTDERFLQLSPLGVVPEAQGRGHGSALVRATLAGARALGQPIIFLEGNPAYYGRFGFVRADELGWLPPPETLVDWAFQVAILDEHASPPRGQVAYAPPFRREG